MAASLLWSRPRSSASQALQPSKLYVKPISFTFSPRARADARLYRCPATARARLRHEGIDRAELFCEPLLFCCFLCCILLTLLLVLSVLACTTPRALAHDAATSWSLFTILLCEQAPAERARASCLDKNRSSLRCPLPCASISSIWKSILVKCSIFEQHSVVRPRLRSLQLNRCKPSHVL
jgi:hypothetical protein